MQSFSIKDLYNFVRTVLPELYYFKKHSESFIDMSLLLEQILLNFTVNHFCTNIPICVIITSISSLEEQGLFILGNRLISEPQLDLLYFKLTFRSFCSCVYSFSKFFGTDTLVFHAFLRRPRWSGSIRLLISSLMVRAWKGISSLEKNCSYLS